MDHRQRHNPLAQKHKRTRKPKTKRFNTNGSRSNSNPQYRRKCSPIDIKENLRNDSSSSLLLASSSVPTSLIDALEKYEKQFQSLLHDHYPLELCGGPDLDLSAWTLVLGDACLDGIARQYQQLDSVATKADGDSTNDSNNYKSPRRWLRSLNLCGGDKFSDAGLKRVAVSCQRLTSMSLENCFQITDRGLKIIVQACPDLQELNLSGCMGISGTGFAVVGDYNPKLEVLKVSGCEQINAWTFMKLFQGCRHLVELDISYCSKITDREIKLLADLCTEVERLNLSYCCHVSDVGVLSLSQGCSSLSKLSLRRSDMPFKITDVSLMALGQGCTELSTLSLRGCGAITDAGLSWLCKGCPSLERIDLTNCSKISNSGIRYLGEVCSMLRSVILTNLKQVSDVGLRYLADGCNFLENLTAAGVYLLSDGIQRDFGFDGLQLMSKSKCAKHIKSLNMHGCFQIQNVALESIGRFTALETLILSGCTKLTAGGISKLANACPQVFELSLSGCGDCISDASMETLAQSMKLLTTVNVSDCKKIGRRGFVALSGCTRLKRLDASGCSRVTDDAVMSLCSGRFTPGLDLLDLSRCPKVSDVALTYIADGLQRDGSFEVTLTKLALKGTAVAPPTLKAIRDQFRYSTMKNNNSFLGFWPLSRIRDRKIINDYGLKSKHAATIQAMYRAWKDSQNVQRAREDHSRKKVATLLSALWRGRQGRLLAKDLRKKKWTQNKVAVNLQCWARVVFAKKQYEIMRRRRWLSVAPFAAVKIQRTFRGWLGRNIAKTTRVDLLETLIKMEEASLTLQAFGRSVIAKTELRSLIAAKEEMKRIQCLSALRIQSEWRRVVSWRILYFRRMVRDAVTVRLDWAARTIQTRYWKHKLRAIIAMRVHTTRLRLSKTVFIQRWIRYCFASFEAKARRAHLRAKERECASIRIQCLVRRVSACSVAEGLKQGRQEESDLKQQKAHTLTRWWRGCLAEIRLRELKRLHHEKVRRELKVQHWAATMIAAGWRGKRGRDKASRAEIARMEKWKEMWSMEEGRPLYYNQLTGELRWRKPQALLDLEPRPVCSNCNYYEAQTECANCVEYFCHQCWEAVHYGGRRAKHKFRSLYDFYGKRVDYGDVLVEFPSLWPTDIEQDDKRGWQRRQFSNGEMGTGDSSQG